ncbi:uncharacterized protein METZ01_LOCUS210674 [marine metagenome]|uniref:Uncharacterized protein n=1 Tax=marine metagenome TaxID=408172 RepID=A0A382F4A9_9ZZZZ
MEDSNKPRETSGKPNNEALILEQLKSIKVALWTLTTLFMILPYLVAIGILLLTLVTGWGPFGHEGQDHKDGEVIHEKQEVKGAVKN